MSRLEKAKGRPRCEHQTQRHAHPLGRHSGQRRSGHAQAAGPYQQQIPGDVHHTGNQHGEQGCFGVPDTSEHGSQHVVGDDEHRAAGADEHIGHSLGEGFFWSLHQLGHRGCRPDHDRCQRQRHQPKQGDSASQDLTALLSLALSLLLPQQHCGSYGQPGDQAGDGVHDLTAGGYGGHVGGLTELTHHCQVHRAVHGL